MSASVDNKVRVRLITPDDVGTLLRLYKAAHARTTYGHIPFDDQQVIDATWHALANPKSHGVILSEAGGEATGVLYVQASPLIFTDIICAQAIVFWVSLDARATRSAVQLLRAFEAWAKNRNAQELQLHVTTGAPNAEQVGRLFERKGYRWTGSNYSCAL
ncbi:N-acetyltransferase family protein [Pyruvatibacter mobilis]|uniref:GNAT family N-acetyltransferase n=1 Tax=Pyruvatibacter mobilis TaxID=1712261 RepID=UPI003D0C14B5